MVRDFIARGYRFLIVTPNPEIILMAQKDRELMQILNKADLAIPDGVALLAADKFSGLEVLGNSIFNFFKLVYCWILYFYVYTFDKQKLEGRVKLLKGRELFMDLVKLANKKGWRVFLLGGLGREAEISKQKLEIGYKKVKIQAFAGPKLDNKAEPVTEVDRVIEKDAIARINNFKPQLLFVAFGAPKQEKWTAGWLDKLDIGGAMVVGGTFSYIAGTGKIPPIWMDKCGLEWLWRLITEPVRAPRIFRATILFPLKVILCKIKK
ncbi:MAG: WecB/TagA/CpsF family glycosyltransferase [bacterium]|nr:WecB/TagA/CpsF family glycosyltransferase [bacterium]